MSQLTLLQKELKNKANTKKAKILQRFFKTGKGDYGEGDIFLGIIVPEIRKTTKKFATKISLTETQELLHSKYHEERLCALLILVEKYKNKKITQQEKKDIYELYLRNTKWINNWDLVDLSAQHIVGAHIFENRNLINTLITLSKSTLLWERRISILSTFYFIYKKEFDLTINIAEILINDKEDLMHKAVGWMLREVGKKGGEKEEEEFLKKHYKSMPRTMLRYAIERFSEEKRKAYLEGKI